MLTEILSTEIPPCEPIVLMRNFIFAIIFIPIAAGIIRLIASVFGGKGSYKKFFDFMDMHMQLFLLYHHCKPLF